MTAKLMLTTPAALEPVITLRQRIADALTQETTTAELRSCIADTQADIARVERDRTRAEARAIDPLSTEEEATSAKRLCESLRFDLDRLHASESRLQLRLEQVTDRDAQAVLQARYEEVSAEREAMIVEIREHYPALAEGIMILLDRMRTVEHQIADVNANLPRDAVQLPWVEAALSEPILLNGPAGPVKATLTGLYQGVQLPRLTRTGGGDDWYKLHMRGTQGVLPY